MKKKQKPTGILKFAQVQTQKEPLQFWPCIHCVQENKTIAIGRDPVKYTVEDGKIKPEKIKKEHWQSVDWVDEKYKIDFTPYDKQVEEGINAIVFCPNCGSPVDFRVFPSTNRPKFMK